MAAGTSFYTLVCVLLAYVGLSKGTFQLFKGELGVLKFGGFIE